MGTEFFTIGNERLSRSRFYGKYVKFEDIKIAFRELLSAVIAFLYFAPKSPRSLIRINCDNQNVVAWLNKSRCTKSLGHRLLSIIELTKLKYNLKVSAFFIKSASNTSADSLSRGHTPRWLKERGTELPIEMKKIDRILSDPISAWKKVLSCRSV